MASDQEAERWRATRGWTEQPWRRPAGDRVFAPARARARCGGRLSGVREHNNHARRRRPPTRAIACARARTRRSWLASRAVDKPTRTLLAAPPLGPLTRT